MAAKTDLSETPVKKTSSVHDIAADKPPFGSRYLTNDADVWSQNAWDHVPAPDDQDEKIAASLARQHLSPVPENDKHKYNEKPARHWDNFYKMNEANFFKNRKWLHTEFSELVAATQPDAGPVRIVEIGCGVGNSIFPLLSTNHNPQLDLHAFDYSNHAVKLVQRNPLYISPPCGTINSSVWDLTTSNGLPESMEPESVDIVILIFVLSALHPNEWARAVSNIYKMLKPTGLVLLRDYGRHDLTQLRFKEGRLLDDHLYIRGDKTRVYFFELDDLARLFTGSSASSCSAALNLGEPVLADANIDDKGLTSVEGSAPILTSDSTFLEVGTGDDHDDIDPLVEITQPVLSDPEDLSRPTDHPPDCPPHPLFSVEQLGVDRRLIVNRKRQLKMYRVWMQGKFRKAASI